MDKFEGDEIMKKKTYKKAMGGIENQIMTLFKTWDYSKPKHVKNVYGD